MKFKTILSPLLLAALASPASAGLPPQITYTWDGGGADANWATAANWSLDTKPLKSSDTILVFAGDLRPAAVNNLGEWALDIGQLNFNSTHASFALTGDAFGFLPLNGSQQINQNSTFPVSIGNTFSFRPTSDSQINLNAGSLELNSTLYLDTASGSSRKLVVGGTTNDRHTLSVNGSIAKGGGGNNPEMVIQNNKRVVVAGACSFGRIVVDSGLLELTSTGSLGQTPVVGNSSGDGDAMLALSTPGQTMSNQISIRDGSTGRRVIAGLNTTGNVTYSGSIMGSGISTAANSYDVVAATGGSVTLSATRYTDSTLHINRPAGSTTYGGTVVLSGGSLSSSGVNVYGGTVSVPEAGCLGRSTVTLDGATLKQSAAFTATGKIVLGSNGGTLDTSAVGSNWTSAPTFSGGISGTGNLVMASTSRTFPTGISGVLRLVEGLRLSGDNSYVGSTTITGGYVNGASATAFGNAANTVVLNGGGLNFDSNRTHNYPITVAAGGGWISVESGFTVNATTAISGSGGINGLNKQGPGTLTLSAENSYTGATTIYKGVVSLAHTRALAGSIVNRTNGYGSLLFGLAGNNIYHLGALIGAETTQLFGNTLSLGGTNLDSVTRMKLAGTGGLIKDGTGKLTLSAGDAQLYTGATTVSAGTLVVNGSLAAGSAVQVYPGATLAGSGTVAGSVLVSGTISPGDNGIGTLRTGSVLLYGTWACDINGTACDVLAVTGDFITGATSRLVVTGTPTADRYVIATYTGNLGSVASSESSVLPGGYELGVDFVNQQVLLVKSAVAPSPYSTWSAGKNLAAGVNDGATQDPDGDGTSNLLEFALGGDPLAADASILPVGTLTADHLVFTFRRSDASKQEVALGFQSSSDLTSWTEVTIGATGAGSVGIAENGADPDTVTITLPRSNEAGGKLFGRLKAALKTAP